MVEWDHSTEWNVADFSTMVNKCVFGVRGDFLLDTVYLSTSWTDQRRFVLQGSSKTGESIIEIDTSKEEQAFYMGHTIDGRVLFPATGYLVSIFWKFNVHLFIFLLERLILESDEYIVFRTRG